MRALVAASCILSGFWVVFAHSIHLPAARVDSDGRITINYNRVDGDEAVARGQNLVRSDKRRPDPSTESLVQSQQLSKNEDDNPIVLDPSPACDPTHNSSCYEDISDLAPDASNASFVNWVGQLTRSKTGGTVKLYGRKNCGMCSWTMRELDKNNIPYEWKDITNRPASIAKANKQNRNEMYQLLRKKKISGSFGIPLCDACSDGNAEYIYVQPRGTDHAFFDRAKACAAATSGAAATSPPSTAPPLPAQPQPEQGGWAPPSGPLTGQTNSAQSGDQTGGAAATSPPSATTAPPPQSGTNAGGSAPVSSGNATVQNGSRQKLHFWMQLRMLVFIFACSLAFVDQGM